MSEAARLAGAVDEVPAFFTAGGETLFGITTRPTVEANGVAVILLPGGDYIPSLNRNRLWVRMARSLAGLGYHTMRFDYHGVGESTGLVEYWQLDEPFADDLSAAVRWLESQGVHEFVLVGVCFGAATALACADTIDGLRGVVVIEHPIYEFEVLETLGTIRYLRTILREQGVRGLLHRAQRLPTYLSLLLRRLRELRNKLPGRRWAREAPVSADFVREVSQVIARRVPMLFVYGTDEDMYEAFDRARAGALGGILRRGGDAVEVRRLQGPIHELTSLQAQEALMDLVEGWIRRRAPGSRRVPTTTE